MNKTRLIEAIITAAVIGGMIYGTFKTDLDNIKETMREMKEDIRTIRHDLYLPGGRRDAWGYRKESNATVKQ